MNERSVEQTRHISITSTSADGVVSRTEVHITTRQCCAADDAGSCDCRNRVEAAREADAHEGVREADITAQQQFVEGECFDPSTCCDAREQALIAALRAYLRPDVAPECLMSKLKATLDHCCGEDR
ncbi:hypothetical protein JS530_09430 [Bifidobacterium sp. LC6]|uniref:Uncharacterized protein n=1 Tax=Bifidobacterium colobi TaxID=2809026 RepID=A0ABS5UY96_9BIFI|nr:hypothetical protein [Bifidobacterium colobi]MBT1175715.1 hypothetical protein [Bifidobacterium colobi]